MLTIVRLVTTIRIVTFVEKSYVLLTNFNIHHIELRKGIFTGAVDRIGDSPHRITNQNNSGMLFMRWQRRKKEAEDGEGHTENSDHKMRRKINDGDLKGESRRAAIRGTLICVFFCGTILLSVGIAVLCVGLLVPDFKKDPTPWLVIGPTCMFLGMLLLLLLVKIILKLRKIFSTKSSTKKESPAKKGKETQKNSCENGDKDEETAAKESMPKAISVVVHPATPLQQLDATLLPVDVVQDE